LDLLFASANFTRAGPMSAADLAKRLNLCPQRCGDDRLANALNVRPFLLRVLLQYANVRDDRRASHIPHVVAVVDFVVEHVADASRTKWLHGFQNIGVVVEPASEPSETPAALLGFHKEHLDYRSLL